MSGATHPHTPTRQVLLRDQRRAKLIALAAVTALAALLATLILVLDGGNSSPVDTDGPAVQVKQQQAAQPGVRYDGGPEEGTVGLAERSAPATFDPNSIKQAPGQRYDGGPEEGAADVSAPVLPQSTRPDGGPEEGSSLR